MKMKFLTALPLLLLSDCSHEDESVRLEDAPKPVVVVPKGKTEPVFYNGKTYRVTLAPRNDGSAVVSISGMGAAQGKDANALANSALFHFACKDSQHAVLHGPAQFSGNMWQAQGRCIS